MLLLYFTYSFRHVRSRCDPQHLIASRAPVLVRSTLLAKVVCIVILTRKEVEEDECPVHFVFRICQSLFVRSMVKSISTICDDLQRSTAVAANRRRSPHHPEDFRK